MLDLPEKEIVKQLFGEPRTRTLYPRHGSCFGSSDRRQMQNGDGWRSTGTIHVLQKALENSGQRSSNVASSPPVYTFYNTFMKHTTGTTGTVVLVHTCVQVHTGVRYMTYIIHTYIESILHTLHVHDMQQGCNFTCVYIQQKMCRDLKHYTYLPLNFESEIYICINLFIYRFPVPPTTRTNKFAFISPDVPCRWIVHMHLPSLLPLLLPSCQKVELFASLAYPVTSQHRR